MSHFALTDGVYFVRGASRGALYDTENGEVFSLNDDSVAVLEGTSRDAAHWQELVDLGLAKPVEAAADWPDLPRRGEHRLQFIWFEILTDDCNLSCAHCYAESMPPSHRRAQGLPVPDRAGTGDKLTFETWCGLIQEGYDAGARSCQFIGGEPFLYRDRKRTVLDLARRAREVGYTFVEIFTNATLLTDASIETIRQLGVNVAVSLYSNDPQEHDRITNWPGSHAKTVDGLERLKAAGIRTRVCATLMSHNESAAKDTMRFVDELGFRGGRPDPLRPVGRGSNGSIAPDMRSVAEYGVSVQPKFRVDAKMLEHYTSGHSCLAGKITITDTGEVYPCIFARSHSLGNTRRQGGLDPVLHGAGLQRVWNTTKDDVMVCRDCEYRYVCFDCRPLSEGVAAGQADFLHAPYPRCSYNPYTGEWAEGLWRMQGGEPVYDRSYREVLQDTLHGRWRTDVPRRHEREEPASSPLTVLQSKTGCGGGSCDDGVARGAA